MTNKNLEKLAKIGEEKLLNDLNFSLMEIKGSLTEAEENAGENSKIEYLNQKVRSYNHLINICKECGVNVNEQEDIYSEIMKSTKEYLKQTLSRISVATQYTGEIKK